eukprot:270081-Pyramimonas_sp.AAC.1
MQPGASCSRGGVVRGAETRTGRPRQSRHPSGTRVGYVRPPMSLTRASVCGSALRRCIGQGGASPRAPTSSIQVVASVARDVSGGAGLARHL